MKTLLWRLLVLCLLFAVPFVHTVNTAGNDPNTEDPIEKYSKTPTDILYRNYDSADDDAALSIAKHGVAVIELTRIRDKIDVNNAGIEASTITSLNNLVVAATAVATAYLTKGTGSVFLSGLGVTTFSELLNHTDKIKKWKNGEDLENLLAAASHIVEAYSQSFTEYKHESDELWTAYDARFNEDGSPIDPNDPHTERARPAQESRELVAAIDYPCANNCGVRFQSYNNSQTLHQQTCASSNAVVPGCGKTYYNCPSKPNISHDELMCTNFTQPLGTNTASEAIVCGMKFRECTPSGCPAAFTYPNASGMHSAVPSEKRRVEEGNTFNTEAICPICKKPHSPSGSGSGSGSQ